jgi:ABC-type antimicrobial peptide transport system permease subunit
METVKKIMSGLAFFVGLTILLLGLFIFNWMIAYIHAPAEYGGPPKVWDWLRVIGVLIFGLVIMVSPAWIGTRKKG